MTKLLWSIAVVVISAVTMYGIHTGGKRFSDFAGYYTASRILTTTGSMLHAFDDEWFISKMNSYGIPDSMFIMYVNPPTIALVTLPVSWLEPAKAKVVWNILNIVLALIAVELLRRLLQIPLNSAKVPLLAILTMGTVPFLRNLQRGQMYILMLILLILFVRGYMERKPIFTSLPLAALLLLKYFGWMFILLLLAERRFREAGLTIGFSVVGFVLGGFVFGFDSYEASGKVLLSATLHSDFATTGLPCVPALFGGLFTFHSVWNQSPIVDLPWLSPLLTTTSAFVMILLTIGKSAPSTPDLRRVACLVVLSVIFTPLAADHHYMLLALPIAVLLNDDADKSSWMKLALVVTLVVLVGWYPQPALSTLAGWEKLLAFPRLYAAIALWFILLVKGHHMSSGPLGRQIANARL